MRNGEETGVDATRPNDPRLVNGGDWHLQKIGAYEAWQGGRGDGVTIAVLDTGVDADHRDLAANMWVNTGEIAGNGIDDDGNGFIDDIHGANFTNDGLEGDINDVQSHGTHVAGIAAAVADNGEGMAGVAPEADIMGVKVLGDNGTGYSSWITKGVEYAIDNGAKVINMSLGGGSASYWYEQAFLKAQEAGVIVVVSAGNSNRNEANWPAAYADRFDNVISVAASTKSDAIASFSNWSQTRTTVNLAAPGGDSILSTTPNDGYGGKRGTSMAAPVVAGAVAAVWSARPDWSYAQVIDSLMSTVSDMASLTKTTVTNGILDLAAAMRAAVGEAPQPPANQAPDLVLSVLQGAIDENTAIGTGGLRVADITVNDDGVGVNILDVTGADAADFIVKDGGLYLRAGATLDFEAQPQLSVTVTVDDETIGTGVEDSETFTLTVRDIDETPAPAPEPAPAPAPEPEQPAGKTPDRFADLVFWFDARQASSTTTLTDLSGAGRDATSVGSSTVASTDGGLSFDGNTVFRMQNDAEINVAATADSKTLTFSFETGNDVTGRQVIYEQGGGARGLSVVIENGKLFLNGWNLVEERWGVSSVSGDVSANQSIVATLVLDGAAKTLSGYMNGESLGSSASAGTLWSHGDDIGLGGVQGKTLAADRTLIETGDAGFKGTLFGAAGHNSILSSTDIADMHAAMSTAAPEPEPSPTPEPEPEPSPTPEPEPEPSPSPSLTADQIEGLAFWFADASSSGEGLTRSLTDLSGNGHNAVASSDNEAAQADASGLIFDGSDMFGIANSNAINTAVVAEAKTLSLRLETGADVSSRQVIYEQGGAARGLSVTIENGQLHVSGWNLVEERWGVSTISTEISAGQDLSVSLVLDGVAGTLTGYLDGAAFGQAANAGRLWAHGNGVGLGGVNGNTVDAQGNKIDHGQSGFAGKLFEASLHNNVLTASEVAGLHAGFQPQAALSAVDSMTFLDEVEEGEMLFSDGFADAEEGSGLVAHALYGEKVALYGPANDPIGTDIGDYGRAASGFWSEGSVSFGEDPGLF